MMKKIVIVGSSGFAREIYWLICRINQIKEEYSFLGYIDNDTGKKEVIGNDDFLINYPDELYVVIAIANPSTRKKIAMRYRNNPNLKFPNLIDPSVIKSDDIILGQGNIICAGSILTVDLKIGDFCIINIDCTLGHESLFKDYVTLNPSVNVSGNVLIEEGVTIGTGSQIIQGMTIEKNSIVGAGAVVVSKIPNDCTAVGVPAKVIKDRRS